MKSSRKAKHGCTLNRRQSGSKEEYGEENAAAGQVDTNQQGLSLERKIEIEKRRRFSLINKDNRSTAAVKEKQDKLEGLKKVIALQRSNKNSEETEKLYQEINQLEMSLEKVKDRTQETRRHLAVVKSISADLKWKSFVLDQELDQKERQLADGLVELEKVGKQRKFALAAAKNKELVQMKNEALRMRKETSDEMQKLNAHQKEIQTRLDALRHSNLITGNNLAEVASSATVTPSSMDQQDSVSETDVQLLEDDLEDMTTLDLREMEQLTEEVYLINEDIRQKESILKELKLHYTILQHSHKAKGKRSHKATEEERMELNKEVRRVEDLRAALKEPQALLSTVEQRIDDMCFELNCITLKELSSLSYKEKIKKICIQLNSQNTDTKKVYNVKDDSSESSEDEGWLTREEIKENSKRLVEAEQAKMASGNRWKKKHDM